LGYILLTNNRVDVALLSFAPLYFLTIFFFLPITKKKGTGLLFRPKKRTLIFHFLLHLLVSTRNGLRITLNSLFRIAYHYDTILQINQSKMPSFKSTVVALLAATASAMPSSTRLSPRELQWHALAKRQQGAAQQAGLSDFDILQL
jgi:hypothetical protein